MGPRIRASGILLLDRAVHRIVMGTCVVCNVASFCDLTQRQVCTCIVAAQLVCKCGAVLPVLAVRIVPQSVLDDCATREFRTTHAAELFKYGLLVARTCSVRCPERHGAYSDAQCHRGLS